MPWFKRPSDGELYLVLDQYPDTIKRLRAEGWPEVEPPVATTKSEAVAARVDVTTPDASPERAATTPTTPKRAPVKAKSVRKRTPTRRPSTTGRKVGQP